jgi:hypothetical protein
MLAWNQQILQSQFRQEERESQEKPNQAHSDLCTGQPHHYGISVMEANP